MALLFSGTGFVFCQMICRNIPNPAASSAHRTSDNFQRSYQTMAVPPRRSARNNPSPRAPRSIPAWSHSPKSIETAKRSRPSRTFANPVLRLMA